MATDPKKGKKTERPSVTEEPAEATSAPRPSTVSVAKRGSVAKPVLLQEDKKTSDPVTDEFLTTLGTPREISKPIKVEDTGRKPAVRTADDYEIIYHPSTDKKHPLEKWRRNRILRCLVTREIARYLDRRTFITVSVREGIIYCVFLFLISFVTFSSFTLEKYYLTTSLIKRYTRNPFINEKDDGSDDDDSDTSDYLMINFHEINTLQHIFFYQRHIVKNLIFAPFWNTPDRSFENKVMGAPQIRQLRVKNYTCDGFLAPNITPPCYGPYLEKNENRSEIGEPARSMTERQAAANKYKPANETHCLPLSGSLATYSGGGFTALFFGEADGQQQNAGLETGKWYDRSTRAVIIEFTMYNGNVNLFCIFKFLFEIPPTGGVIPSARIYVKKLIRYDSPYDYFILMIEVICMMFIFFYTLQKLLEICALRMKLFKTVWTYIDIVLLLMAYLTMWYDIQLHNAMQAKMPELVDPKYNHKFISFDTLLHLHILFSRCFATLTGFAFLRLLKYFNIVHSMHQLQTTITRALPELINYFIFFFYFYFVFAMVGVFLFGNKLEDFKTFIVGLYSLMRYSIADFKYWQLEQADPIMGPIFFAAFIFTICFILANIFVAILVSKYQEVRSEVSIGKAKTYIKDMLMIWFLQLLSHMECPWLLSQIEREEFEEKVKSPTEHVRYYLRQAGYSELEIELFFKKYEITDSKIEVMDLQNTPAPKKGEREAPPPLSQKDIIRYIVIHKLEYLENHYSQASKLIDEFLNKLTKLEKKL